jgi:hypothetical protein
MCELAFNVAGERHGNGMVCVNPPLLRQRQMNLHWMLQTLTPWVWMQSLQVDGLFPHEWLVWVTEMNKLVAFPDHCVGGYLDRFALPHTVRRPVIEVVNRQVQSRIQLVILQLTYRAALNPLYFQRWQWLSINTHFGSNKPYSICKIYATFRFRVTDAFRQWTTDPIQSETNESFAIFHAFSVWEMILIDTY